MRPTPSPLRGEIDPADAVGMVEVTVPGAGVGGQDLTYYRPPTPDDDPPDYDPERDTDPSDWLYDSKREMDCD